MIPVLAQGILDFWFGPLDAQGLASEKKRKNWFSKNDDFDKSIKSQFGNLMELAPMGAYDLWIKAPESRVALVVLMDQFSRNLFRGKPRAFYCDEKTQVVTMQAIKAGEHLSLPVSYGYFVLMPLMHAEKLELQDLGVKLFGELHEQNIGKGAAETMTKGALAYMKQHRDIIAQFGRFPHRNEIMGRESTPEESVFLKNGGPTF